MVLEELALRWLVLAIRFGPWREELLRQWRLRSRGVKRDRASTLAACLISCFRTMCSDKCAVWILNVGHQQCHVSGPLALFKHLGLLRNGKPGQPGAVLTAYQKWKQLLPAKAAKVQLAKWIAVADDVGELRSPCSCREWIDMHMWVHDIIVKNKVRGLRGRRHQLHKTNFHRVRGKGAGSVKQTSTLGSGQGSRISETNFHTGFGAGEKAFQW